MSRRVVALSVAAVVVASSACAAVLGLPSPTESEGEGDGSVPPADAAPGDGSSVVDGGDGGSQGPWCARFAPDATFCDDFDEHTLGSGWEQVFHPGNGAIRFDDAVAISPPNALLAFVPGGDGGASLYRHVMPVPMRFASLSFDARFDAADPATGPGTGACLASFDLYDGQPQPTSVRFLSRASNAYLDEAISPPDGGKQTFLDQDLTQHVEVGAFHRVEMRVALGAAPHVDVSFDGTPAGTMTLSPRFADAFDSASISIGLPFVQSRTTADFQVRIDDVVYDGE